MRKNRIFGWNEMTALVLAVCLLAGLATPCSAAAVREVGYMPGVTEEMTDPAFWAALTEDPDALLATPEEIERINAGAAATEGANRLDMRNAKESFDGVARNEALQRSAADDAKYYLGWVWDQNGKKMEQEDFDRIIENCLDPDAATEMAVRWGIAVNRTELL